MCTENKGVVQLSGYSAADLRFIFAYAESSFSFGAAH